MCPFRHRQRRRRRRREGAAERRSLARSPARTLPVQQAAPATCSHLPQTRRAFRITGATERNHRRTLWSTESLRVCLDSILEQDIKRQVAVSNREWRRESFSRHSHHERAAIRVGLPDSAPRRLDLAAKLGRFLVGVNSCCSELMLEICHVHVITIIDAYLHHRSTPLAATFGLLALRRSCTESRHPLPPVHRALHMRRGVDEWMSA